MQTISATLPVLCNIQSDGVQDLNLFCFCCRLQTRIYIPLFHFAILKMGSIDFKFSSVLLAFYIDSFLNALSVTTLQCFSWAAPPERDKAKKYQVSPIWFGRRLPYKNYRFMLVWNLLKSFSQTSNIISLSHNIHLSWIPLLQLSEHSRPSNAKDN